MFTVPQVASPEGLVLIAIVIVFWVVTLDMA